MKKLYILLVIALIGFVGNAQIVNIPDANFKAKLLLASSSNQIAKNLSGIYFKIDNNNDGQIQISEALQVSFLDINTASIASLEGIASFSNLAYLSFYSNQVAQFNSNGLTNLNYLDSSNNPITTLNLNGCPNLNYLICENNLLTSLDLSGFSNLEFLACSNNLLTTLTLNPLTNLQQLVCPMNQLTSLNISSFTNLGLLDCSNNQLSTLNVSGLVNLETIQCGNNQLTGINVNGLINLAELEILGNSITALDVNGLINLQYLNCNDTMLTSLDVSGSPNLLSFYCANTPLITLNIKNGVNEILDFSGNTNLQYICADESQLYDIQNKITQYGYTNCHVNSYCSFVPGGNYYTIQGNNKFDQNNNGCDASDTNFPNLRLNCSDGTATVNLIFDATGTYRYDVQAGTQTLTPAIEYPSYFNISPSSVNVTFPTTASPVVQDFCIAPNGIHNDVEVVLLPMFPARPGYDAPYRIVYKNNGTTTQSGSVDLSFNDAVLDFVSATPTVSSQSANSLNWSFSNLLPFETREIMLVLNVNAATETPAVNAGDVLSYTATITGATDETPNDNTSTLNQTVVNSLDPNDKTCLEGTTVSPSMVGQYVHYVVRFENDGTANAQNIVVKDMIDTSKFDVSTLVPLSGSAPFSTRVTNTNQVEFIFQNINLPYTTGTSTGYVAFKIKTKPTLVVGNTFNNSASIFFDYNAPIVTNTYTTTIAALATQDFDFGTYFSVYPNPVGQVLNLQTKVEIGVKSINIYNMLGQMVIAIPNAESVSAIDVSDLKTGTYFIKVNTDMGTGNTKFIKE